jgi:flagellar biosynthesis protein FlhA
LIIDGVVLSEGRIYLDKFLAVNPGGPRRTLMGEKVLDPICSLEAYWINNSEKEHAENEGFTIIDPKLVIATHLSHVIEANVHKLLGFSETEALLNKLSETSPKLVQELTPSRLSISVINKTLQMLLIEGIPLTDFKGIAESLIVAASNSTDPKELLKAVRLSISSLITQIVSGDFNELSIVTISPALGKKIEKMSRESNSPLFDSEEVHQIQGIIYQYIRTRENRDSRIVFVVQADLRQFLARFVRVISTKIHVLSFDEIPETRRIKIVGSIG